ncbi:MULTISPECIES: hypothetical protein [Duncaniella]|jgi:hypothetical protein|uniref:Uncharacterized protein n=1 Tax=Duncaniella freteri TaxID=2530391 RepID=A0A4Z0V457_9BACT|nr:MULTISPECIES: hypothetical protein [Duncaniella]QCD39688.1 hypothetical protein E7745_09190 [Duncaniella sp. C9]ROT10412.1 hypothetical protein EEL42_03370 [Muribaculaceae bacterium Isolate-100 (HZI)]RXE66275.1 hypothetical protein ED388_04645 [Muribaculaceae bacterium Isolate-007 (NCI)]TGG36576.1 hypothetical protein EZ315_12105 [Duncaniella freteri]
MGYKLHVAEEYQVRHNSSDAFSNRSAEINRMLHENCPDLTWMGEDVECSEQLKVPRSDLADLIGKIVADREDFDKWLKLYDIQESVDDVIRIIAGWISKSDQRNDYVVLTWY